MDPIHAQRLRTVGDHIRERRRNLGLRQQDVADLVGASKPTIGGWEARGPEASRPIPAENRRVLGYSPDTTLPAAVRRRFHLARWDVAEILGLSYVTLWAWDTGRRQPRGRSLALLAESSWRTRTGRRNNCSYVQPPDGDSLGGHEARGNISFVAAWRPPWPKVGLLQDATSAKILSPSATPRHRLVQK